MSGNTRHVINMANSIVGVSILSMPYCFKEAGLVLATILVLFSGVLTKKTCMYLIHSAMMSRRRSYELLAFQVFGVAGKLLMELCLICFLLGICISFHVVMGDLAPSIVANYMNIENSPSLRSTILCGIVLLVILPLCLLRNIDSLASMSACSIGFYVFLNSIVFYAALPRLLDGSWLSMVKLWETKKALHVLPIMSLALSCQSNVFEIYDSLPDPDVVKMKWVVGQAVNLCCALYIGVGFLGYIAFADIGIGGNVIMSFPKSGLTDSIKMLFVISLAISFPLMLFPCRTSIHSLFYRSVSQVSYTDLVGNYMPEARFRIITIVVLIFSLILGILLPNIEFVLGLLGSTMGMLIAIILPSLFFIKVFTKLSADRILAQALLLFGLFVMLTGTFIHLHSINKSSDVIPVNAPIQKLDDSSIKAVPLIPDKVGIPVLNVEKLEVRKEPAIPEPPNGPVAEVVEAKKDGLVPKIPPVKKYEPSLIVKAVSPKALPKVADPDGLHPDAIKHEDKEKAVENKEKEVIEQKQEKILNYIEEQQKKQNEMLEILHELKDKNADKEAMKPETDVANNPNAPSKLTDNKYSKPPPNLTDAKYSKPPELLQKADSMNQDKGINFNPPKLRNDGHGEQKAPNLSRFIRPSKIIAGFKTKDELLKAGSQATNQNSNNSNKHDEERKRRDLRDLEKSFDRKSDGHADKNAANLHKIPDVADFHKEAVSNLLESVHRQGIVSPGEARRLLWNDLKIRRRKKHRNGEEYWDEI